MRENLQKQADTVANLHEQADKALADRLNVVPVKNVLEKAIPLRITSTTPPGSPVRVEKLISK